MQKQPHPPIKTPMYDPQGNMNHVWVKWFEVIGRGYDDFRKPPDVTYTVDASLTTNDFGKTVLFDTSAGDIVCSLMNVTAKDVWCWLTIFRQGTNRLTIQPGTGTAIEYGSVHGRIWNDEVKRKAANVTLQLISTTQWGIIGATGLWKIA